MKKKQLSPQKQEEKTQEYRLKQILDSSKKKALINKILKMDKKITKLENKNKELKETTHFVTKTLRDLIKRL